MVLTSATGLLTVLMAIVVVAAVAVGVACTDTGTGIARSVAETSKLSNHYWIQLELSEMATKVRVPPPPGPPWSADMLPPLETFLQSRPDRLAARPARSSGSVSMDRSGQNRSTETERENEQPAGFAAARFLQLNAQVHMKQDARGTAASLRGAQAGGGKPSQSRWRRVPDQLQHRR